MTCRNTEVKNQTVSFKRKNSTDEEEGEEEINLNDMTDNNGSTNEDLVNINGEIIQISEELSIEKFDSTLQKKKTKVYRTAVLANNTGAILLVLWENLANNVTYFFIRKHI